MAEAAEKLGEQNPPTDFQAEEYARAKAEESPVAAPLTAQEIEKRALRSAITDLDRMRASQEREIALYPQKEAALEPMRQGMQQEIARQQGADRPAPPEVPVRPPIPTRSQYVDQTAARTLFAVASAIAGLAMAGGRGRGMLAMAGMTGAMQGFQEGNAEKYKAGIEEYKLQVREQLDTYDMMQTRYLDILKQGKLSLDQKIQMYDIEASRWQDKIAQEAAQQKNIGAMIHHADEIAKTSATLRNSAEMAGLKLQALELGLQSKQLDIQNKLAGGALDLQKKELDIQKKQLELEKPERKDDAKLGPAGFYYDKGTGEFTPSIPTRGELRDEPSRYVRMSADTKKSVEFLINARTQIPRLKELAQKVLPSGTAGTAPAWLSGITAEYRSGANAEDVKEFKNRRATLITEATRFETGGSRVLGSVVKLIEEQLPTPSTNRGVGLRTLNTLDELIKNRIDGFLQQKPAGNEIRVKEKSSGRTGRIPENEFDPKLYERVQ